MQAIMFLEYCGKPSKMIEKEYKFVTDASDIYKLQVLFEHMHVDSIYCYIWALALLQMNRSKL